MIRTHQFNYAIIKADAMASREGCQYVTTRHLLLGLLSNKNGATELLELTGFVDAHKKVYELHQAQRAENNQRNASEQLDRSC